MIIFDTLHEITWNIIISGEIKRQIRILGSFSSSVAGFCSFLADSQCFLALFRKDLQQFFILPVFLADFWCLAKCPLSALDRPSLG